MRIGDEAEQEVIDYLTLLGFNATKNDDKQTRLYYDVIASYEAWKITLEVKNDVMARKTGNIALEYYNSKSNKASGITATKANWWVHKVNGELWTVQVPVLINFTKNVSPVRIVNGGGDNNADIMLYKIESFTDIAKPLTLMEIKELCV
jgi:hypothetical protein